MTHTDPTSPAQAENAAPSLSYAALWHRLSPLYGGAEARAIVRTLLTETFSLTTADLYCDGAAGLSDAEKMRLSEMMERLAQAEPLQYVTGEERFCGHTFHVAPGVLIPRPETEGLVDMALHALGAYTRPASVLDIGTGSGCIAASIVLALPQTSVTAWDISDAAVAIACDNVRRLHAAVTIEQRDALCPPDDTGRWDLIVSNPPYICRSEQAAMHRNVTDYEPDTALFVPDDDPLLFYRAIARYAAKALRQGGTLLFECNTAYAADTAHMLRDMGYADATVSDDLYGKPRFAGARRA